MDVQKLPNAPFYICRHYATYRGPKKIKKFLIFFLFFPLVGFAQENTWHIEVLLLFLILRYGADLGRSRLVQLFHFVKFLQPSLFSLVMSKLNRDLIKIDAKTHSKPIKKLLKVWCCIGTSAVIKGSLSDETFLLPTLFVGWMVCWVRVKLKKTSQKIVAVYVAHSWFYLGRCKFFSKPRTFLIEHHLPVFLCIGAVGRIRH